MDKADDLAERAARDAVSEIRPAGLTLTGALVLAGVAADAASRTLPAGVTETERYAKMNAAARDALSREVHRQRLIGGVERLPSRQQVALHLSLLDGLTDEEIAQAMRTTPADVVTLLNLAYSQLRRTV